MKGSPFEREEEAALHQPIIREGEVSFRGDDEMVQHREFQQFATLDQLAGEADIHLRGPGIAAGVVVCHDDGDGIAFERHLEDTLWIGHRARLTTLGEQVITQDLVRAAQQQQVETLDVFQLLIPYTQELLIDIPGRGERFEIRGFDLVTVAYLDFSQLGIEEVGAHDEGGFR